MKTFILTTIALMLITTMVCADTKSKITDVIVYPDRALVTRAIQLNLTPGKHRILVKDASPNLIAESLRAFSADRNLVVQGIHSFLEKKLKATNAVLQKMTDEITSLETVIQSQENKRDRLHRDNGYLQQYISFTKKLISAVSALRQADESGPTIWQQALSFLSERSLANQREIQKLDETIKDLREKLSEKEKNRDTIASDNEKTERTVEITVQAQQNANTTLQFSYLIQNVSWWVSYAMYLQEDSRIALEYKGNVMQWTGEDWSDVVLYLSTSRPSHGAKRPVVYPLTVVGQKQQTQQVFQVTQSKLEKPVDSTPAIQDFSHLDLDQVSNEFSTIEKSGNALMFRMRSQYSVASKRQSQQMSIARYDVSNPEMSFKVVPSRQKLAHWMARFPNRQPFPLLQGSVDLYRKSGYVGTSRITYVAPGGPVEIGFGVDRDIKVYRMVSHKSETKGLLNDEKVFINKIVTRLRNDSKRSVTLLVYDRVPVSQVEEVKINILNTTTSGYKEIGEKSGIFEWRITLSPGQEKEVNLDYDVIAPKNFPTTIYPR